MTERTKLNSEAQTVAARRFVRIRIRSSVLRAK
jgi:hypothetical protein